MDRVLKKTIPTARWINGARVTPPRCSSSSADVPEVMDGST